MKRRRAIAITNETKNLALVREIVGDFLAHCSLNDDQVCRVVLAIDEALANVINHAYGPVRGIIGLELVLDEKRFEIRIRDHGEPFRPTRFRDPDIGEHVRLGLKGGLGVYLMRRVMDEVRYIEKPSFNNELLMIKRLA